LLSAGEDRTVRAWDLGPVLGRGGAEPLTVHRSRRLEPGAALFRALAVSPDGRLAAAGGDRAPRVWATASGEEGGETRRQPGSVRALACSADGTLLAGAAGRNLRVWEVGRAGDPAALELAHMDAITALAFDREGRTLVSGDSDRAVHL